MDMDIDRLEKTAQRASALLKAMSNQHRLIILCQLVTGEKSVRELEKTIRLSQSALSQHLAVLRKDHLVATRRDSQTIFCTDCIVRHRPRHPDKNLRLVRCRREQVQPAFRHLERGRAPGKGVGSNIAPHHTLLQGPSGRTITRHHCQGIGHGAAAGLYIRVGIADGAQFTHELNVALTRY